VLFDTFLGYLARKGPDGLLQEEPLNGSTLIKEIKGSVKTVLI
jgi:hypothetical protein